MAYTVTYSKRLAIDNAQNIADDDEAPAKQKLELLREIISEVQVMIEDVESQQRKRK